MRTRPRILVVGSLVMDLTVSTAKFPASGETVLGFGYRTAPGGKGANQAIQAARLGADVTMVGHVGNDDFGEKLVLSCKEAGIHTEYIAVDNSTCSAIGNVQLETKGDVTNNRIIVVPGANMGIKPEQVGFLQDYVSKFDIVMLQLEIPKQINEIIVSYAYKKNIPVMLNPAPSDKLSEKLMSHLTYISPNEHETEDLTGIHIRKNGKQVNLDDVQKAADVFLKYGVKNVVVTLGNAGAVIANKNVFFYEPCADVVDVKDPTAAGDSFVSAFSVAVCLGIGYKDALHFASYTSALTVSQFGAQPSLPKLNDVINLMEHEHDLTCDLSLLSSL